MSNGAITAALSRRDHKGAHGNHGFRASFRTIADEVLGENIGRLERVLAHAVGSEVERVYSCGQQFERMRETLPKWADHADRLRNGVTVLPFERAASA